MTIVGQAAAAAAVLNAPAEASSGSPLMRGGPAGAGKTTPQTDNSQSRVAPSAFPHMPQSANRSNSLSVDVVAAVVASHVAASSSLV